MVQELVNIMYNKLANETFRIMKPQMVTVLKNGNSNIGNNTLTHFL